MSLRKPSVITLNVSRSVQFTFAAVVGVSLGYALIKWMGEGSRDASPTTKRKTRKIVPGLLNVGNSCFMNTLLQCFASCPSYVEWLKKFTESTRSDDDECVYMADVLLKILKVLTGDDDRCGDYFDPSELLQDMGGRGWQISSQEQDAHEFFHAIMTTLHEEHHHRVSIDTRLLSVFEVKELLSRPISLFGTWNQAGSSSSKPPSTTPKLSVPPFRGTLACVLKCQECGYQNPIRHDGFDSISLSLPWSTEINLLDCLHNFMASELVCDVTCKNCSKLQSTDSSKKSTILITTKLETDSTAPETLKQNNNIIKDAEKSQILSSNGDSESRSTEERTDVRENGDAEDITNKINENIVAKNAKYTKLPFPKLELCSQRQSFDKYFERTFLENKVSVPYEIEYLPVKRTFSRTLCIGKLPDCLCIHLQRLVWTNGTPVKKMNFVNFPELLDVGPYTNISRVAFAKKLTQTKKFQNTLKQMTPSDMHKILLMKRQQRSNSLNDVGVSSTPPISLQGGSQNVCDVKTETTTKISSQKALYRLTSVIVHLGDWSSMGHFLAYRRSPEMKDGESGWIYTSDTIVRKATVKEVFSCPAYMLFYERIMT